MKKILLITLAVLSFLMIGCSIGKDKKAFKCTQWEVTQNNSSQADKLASIQSSALGSIANFEFYDNQVKMNFMGDQIVFTKNQNGSLIYEKPYYIQGKSGVIEFHLCPRKAVGYNFITSIDLYFYVDNNNCGNASFSRNW